MYVHVTLLWEFFLVKLTLRWESQLGTRLASKFKLNNKLIELLLQRRRPKWPVVPSWVMQHLQNVILQCKGSRCAEHSTFYFEILCWKLSSQSKFWYFQSFSWKVIPPMDSMAWRAKYSGVSCPEGVCCLMRAWLLVHQEQDCWCIKTRHYCIISAIYYTSNPETQVH